MGANLSGKDIANGDFMIKTSVADPEAGYAKEKFHADPKNGVIISEVDGPKGKRLEFSADWSVVSLDTKLQEGENIEISEDPVSGKVEISAPDVGKVLVDSNDTTLKYLDDAITSSDNSIQHETSGNMENLTVPNLGKVKTDSEDTFGYLVDKIIAGDNISVEQGTNAIVVSCPDLGIVKTDYNDTHPNFLSYKIDPKFPVGSQIINPYNNGNPKLRIKVANKLVFSQFNAKLGDRGYDDYPKSFNEGIACVYGKILNDGSEILGINFCIPRIVNPDSAHNVKIVYKYTGGTNVLTLYVTSDPTNWNLSADFSETRSVDISGDLSGDPSTETYVPITNPPVDMPLYCLLVCDGGALTDDLKIFDIYVY